MFHQPAGLHAHVLGVGVAADVAHLIQRRIGVGPAADETDGLPLQQELALVPVVLAPHDRKIGLPLLQFTHAVSAVVAGHFQVHVGVTGRVVRQNLG